MPPIERYREWWSGLRRRIAAGATLVRRVAGMPDYEEYLAHLRRAHPDRPAPGRREFYDEYLRSRYGGGPSRCC